MKGKWIPSKGLFTNYVSYQRGKGGWKMLTLADKGGGGRGVWQKQTLADKEEATDTKDKNAIKG